MQETKQDLPDFYETRRKNPEKSCWLQILFRPGVNAIERFLDVLHRICDAEPQVTFSKIAECSSRQSRYAGFFEQRVRHLFRLPTGLSDVWKDIERAPWRATRETFDFVQACNHHVATFFEFGAHSRHRILRTAQRFDPRNLCETRRARI